MTDFVFLNFKLFDWIKAFLVYVFKMKEKQLYEEKTALWYHSQVTIEQYKIRKLIARWF